MIKQHNNHIKNPHLISTGLASLSSPPAGVSVANPAGLKGAEVVACYNSDGSCKCTAKKQAQN